MEAGGSRVQGNFCWPPIKFKASLHYRRARPGRKKANKKFPCRPRNIHSPSVGTPDARSILQSERLLQYKEKLEYYSQRFIMFYLFIFACGGGTQCGTPALVEIKGQLRGAGFPHQVGPKVQTQVSSLGSEHLYQPSQLAGPIGEEVTEFVWQ